MDTVTETVEESDGRCTGFDLEMEPCICNFFEAIAADEPDLCRCQHTRAEHCANDR